MIFGLAAPAVDILKERADIALCEIGDDEPCVGSFRANLDTGDDALDAAPALRPIVKFFEAAHLAILFRRGLVARLRAGLEALDMPPQCRGRRDTQDVIDSVCPTPIENLWTAIVAIGAQEDLGLGPVGADAAQQAAQEGANLLAAGPFGGTKNGGDEAALAIEHDDRLKAVFVVMGIEQPQLLGAMNRIERVVDIERNPFGHLPERFAIQIDHGSADAQQGASIGQVFQARNRRLRTQLAIRWRQIERHLEYRIATQGIGVVAVFVAR